jgi:hypothetical protein
VVLFFTVIRVVQVLQRLPGRIGEHLGALVEVNLDLLARRRARGPVGRTLSCRDRHGAVMKTDAATLARVHRLSFASVYPMYVQKVERKGRKKAEVDEAILWLTGHTAASLRKAMAAGQDMQTFFAKAPRMHPNAGLITGLICGVRVEEIEDETMKRVRQLDKLVDEIAKGRPMEKVLRK